ncbi:hypothetical protein CBR_g4394 [Chara braunii]|uniref:Uncharacterized protein n=1 Tax=Chara braunii TaxID=69332 RepID=A0A388KHM2_CHABU|nr:hypothetical protein CBR_g4394 [Chara braunii]|eukprot:GBG69560.1 hypothetical protein CBR_g4394 [Chara braunii]
MMQAAIGLTRIPPAAGRREGAMVQGAQGQGNQSTSDPAGRGDDDKHEDGQGHDERRNGSRDGDGGDDEPLTSRRKRTRQEEKLEEKARLWVDCEVLGYRPGKRMRDLVTDCDDYYMAIVNGDFGVETPPILNMPPADVPHFKIEDPAQHGPALRRARNSERVALRFIHN